MCHDGGIGYRYGGVHFLQYVHVIKSTHYTAETYTILCVQGYFNETGKKKS